MRALGRVLINAGIGRMSALGVNRTRRDGGNDVNDPERKSRVPKCCDAHTVFPATLVASLVRPGGPDELGPALGIITGCAPLYSDDTFITLAPTLLGP